MPNPLKILWLDTETTKSALKTREAVEALLGKAKDAGFNIVMPAARTHSGVAFYNTRLTSTAAEVQHLAYPPDFDLLRTVINEGRKRNLQVHPCIAAFVQGTPSSGARKRAAEVIDELLSNYNVDGLALNHLSMEYNFSQTDRALFEKQMKVKAKRWPEDVCITMDPVTSAPGLKGLLHDKWNLWRAQATHDFINDVHGMMKGHQTRTLAVVTQSPYQLLPKSGVNWAASDVDPRGFALVQPGGYSKTGFAHMVDFLSPDVDESTLTHDQTKFEGSIDLAVKATGGAVPIAPRIRTEKLNSEELVEEAIRVSIQRSGGVMVFSHTTVENGNLWEAARRGLDTVPQLPER